MGKNNTQNDQLTFHFAEPNDIWMHANDMPGSHVILRSGGRTMEEIPDRAFEEAASLAAWYSAGREQGKVEIDYLLRRNVKKPGGAKSPAGPSRDLSCTIPIILFLLRLISPACRRFLTK